MAKWIAVRFASQITLTTNSIGTTASNMHCWGSSHNIHIWDNSQQPLQLGQQKWKPMEACGSLNKQQHHRHQQQSRATAASPTNNLQQHSAAAAPSVVTCKISKEQQQRPQQQKQCATTAFSRSPCSTTLIKLREHSRAATFSHTQQLAAEY
ncbi:MAG: hypothetical protein FRX48_09820 [Lasallia pustulata]|uniref:Uncharacterized protein n=1 Tax=Lasallia pustulata TaxID=136370 RepID=A0A5M8PBF8_9LECA|nr:MAG: hypothetical protein FRX48_09820 [Lasallia pustulata]